MEVTKLKLAIFISGRGSNMKAIIDACACPDYPAQVSLVISNRADAKGLEYARLHGIETHIIESKKYNDRNKFDQELNAVIAPYNIDLIVLAGFMRILGAPFVDCWQNKIINIHPSLLPDYKGTNTHARVLADGKDETGCTVHFVVTEIDSGEIIIQKKVPINEEDTIDTLEQKVLEQEHLAYPQAIKIISDKFLVN